MTLSCKSRVSGSNVLTWYDRQLEGQIACRVLNVYVLITETTQSTA